MASEEFQAQAPRRTSTLLSIGTENSIDISTTLHVTCRKCYHYHHAKAIEFHLSRRRSIGRKEFRCDKCHCPMFAFGDSIWHHELLSQETLNSDNVESSIETRSSRRRCVDSRPPEHRPRSRESSNRQYESIGHVSGDYGYSSRSSHESMAPLDDANDPELQPPAVVPSGEDVDTQRDSSDPASTAIPHRRSSRGMRLRLAASAIGRRIGNAVERRFRRVFRRSVEPPTNTVVQEAATVARTEELSRVVSPTQPRASMPTSPPNAALELLESPSQQIPDQQSVHSLPALSLPESLEPASFNMTDLTAIGSSGRLLQGHEEVPEEVRQIRRQRTEDATVNCDCQTCDCTTTGNCRSGSVRVSGRSSERRSTPSRPPSTNPDPRYLAPQSYHHITWGIRDWIADQQEAEGASQGLRDLARGRPYERPRLEREQSQSTTQRCSVDMSISSGTTAVMTNDTLDPPYPPAPTPPPRTDFVIPAGRSFSSISIHSTRSLPLPFVRPISTQNLQAPPLETLGERSSASENSQDQQRALTDGAVQADLPPPYTDAVSDGILPETQDTFDNVMVDHNPIHIAGSSPDAQERRPSPRSTPDGE